MAEPVPRRQHPLFDRLPQGPTGALEAITERRVQQARDDGLFDDLPGAGKPIPDIDQQRPPGWWANRLVKRERSRLREVELEDRLRLAMPGLWRLATEPEVEQRVGDLNDLIEAYNRTTLLSPRGRLDPAEMLATWRRLRST